MKQGLAIEALYSWFENRPFRIQDLESAQVEELAELIDDRSTEDSGRRSRIGMWLTSLDGRHIQSESVGFIVAVHRRANQSQPGIYRISEYVHPLPAPRALKNGSLLMRLLRRFMFNRGRP